MRDEIILFTASLRFSVVSISVSRIVLRVETAACLRVVSLKVVAGFPFIDRS